MGYLNVPFFYKKKLNKEINIKKIWQKNHKKQLRKKNLI